jgi:hypothetical protein
MDDLLIKYILDETSPEERGQVQQWLAADAANQARFEKLQTVWQVAAQRNSQLIADTPQALQRLKHTLQTRQPVPVKRIWARIGTAAAAVVGLAGVVLGAYVVMKPKPPAKKTTPTVKPDTVQQKRLLIDTIPIPADTLPAVKPVKKKLRIPATPAQPVRPKKKAVEPVPAVDPIQPVPMQSLHTEPIMKKHRLMPVLMDTTLMKRKRAKPTQPADPVRKYKLLMVKE